MDADKTYELGDNIKIDLSKIDLIQVDDDQTVSYVDDKDGAKCYRFNIMIMWYGRNKELNVKYYLTMSDKDTEQDKDNDDEFLKGYRAEVAYDIVDDFITSWDSVKANED